MFLTTVPAAAFAQSGGSVDKRVGVLEKQMQAVQRKVFPGADPRFFEPEIAPAPTGVAGTGLPATTPLADLTARVNSLEKQMTTLTGQNEQNSFRIRQLEEQLAKFRGDAEFRRNTHIGRASCRERVGPYE